MKELLDRMVEAKQLSFMDADVLARRCVSGAVSAV